MPQKKTPMTPTNDKTADVPRRRVVTICGSTRYWDQLLECAEALSVGGDIVLFPFVNMRSNHWSSTDDGPQTLMGWVIKANLDDMHCDKISMSDAIYVVNVDGYVGESTRKEIEFAEHEGVDVIYLVPEMEFIPAEPLVELDEISE